MIGRDTPHPDSDVARATTASEHAEQDRIAQLRALALLDTEPEERFDRVTRLAQRLFGVPIALVSLVDVDRQWFKSRQGLEVPETPREHSFCAHALAGDEILHVRDATADPRFADNPLVLDAPEIRFYAGCPITGPGGATLGTLCIIDREPRALTAEDAALLRDLAEVVEGEIAALHLAAGDELTGLLNRRGFEQAGSTLLEICAGHRLPATLLFFDLDGLKSINDTHGHGAGDQALTEFAAVLEHTFRGSDVIARLGGDEYAVLLVGAADVTAPIARMHELLAARTMALDESFELAASVGTATFDPRAGEGLEELTAQADEAMYEHKQSKAAGQPQ